MVAEFYRTVYRSRFFQKALYFQRYVAERVGFQPTVRFPVQRFSSSKIFVLRRVSRAEPCRPIAKCTLLLATFLPRMLARDAL